MTSKTAPRRARNKHARRPAASGMFEALVLIGISVAGAGALAAWFYAFDAGWGDGGGAGRCTLQVDAHKDIGAQGAGFVEVTVQNTGDEDITRLSIRVGESFVHQSSVQMAPGETYGYAGIITAAGDTAGPAYAEAVATLAGGSTMLCDSAGLRTKPAGGG